MGIKKRPVAGLPVHYPASDENGELQGKLPMTGASDLTGRPMRLARCDLAFLKQALEAGVSDEGRSTDFYRFEFSGLDEFVECQTAFKRDPLSASKRDPLFGYDAG
jgi:hypothetical protein